MGNICTSDKQNLPYQPLLAPQSAVIPSETEPTAQEPVCTRSAENFGDAVNNIGEGSNTVLNELQQQEDALPGATADSDNQQSDSGADKLEEFGSSTAGNVALAEECAPFTPNNTSVQSKENVPPPSSTSLNPEAPPSGPPPNYRARRRGSVSAEVASLAASASTQAAKPRRSFDTEQVIMKAMTHSFLFSDLEEEQKVECIASMFRKEVVAGEVLIRQGEEGDNFYVIAEGAFTARIAQPGGPENVVFTYEGRGAFGELALMYNCPRAATVQAETEGLVWGMDRSTFRRIILVSRMAQRERFEVALARMSVFSSLSPVQRASIADCLVLEIIEEGTTILQEGEELTSESKFYIVEEGTVACFLTVLGEQKPVKEIQKGGFFGEVALVTKSATRAATCAAKTRCKLLTMGRDAFERLMGPAEEILKKEVEEYERLNKDIFRQASDAALLSETGEGNASPTRDASNASKLVKQGGSGSQISKAGRQSSVGKRAGKKPADGSGKKDGPRYSLV